MHRGLELDGRVQLISGLYFGSAYAYSDFTYAEFTETSRSGPSIVSNSRTGNRIQLVPMHQYSFFLDYKHPSGLSARIGTNTWKKYYVDAANSESYSGFTVANVRVGYDWDRFGVFFRVDNAFDKQYAAEVTKSYGTTSYSPAAPRTWTAGASYKF